MSGVQKSASIAAVLTIAVVLMMIIGVAGFYFSLVSHVMTKTNPDGGHTAKLHRIDGIDVIFKVTVDGNNVYSSPDFAPADADFREQIVWNADGNIVVLEIGEEHLFGYNATERRSLSDDELLNVEFTPFDALGYEGTLPTELSAE
jgi:hypothetical protein